MTREAALFILNHQVPVSSTCWWCGWEKMEHDTLCPLWLANKSLEEGRRAPMVE